MSYFECGMRSGVHVICLIILPAVDKARSHLSDTHRFSVLLGGILL